VRFGDGMIISLAWRPLGVAMALACFALPAAAQTAHDAELHQQMQQASEAGQYETALPFAQQLLASAEQQLRPDDPRLAGVMYEVGGVYRLAARTDDAIALFKRAVAIREHAYGQDAPQVGEVLNAIGVTASENGRYAEAEQAYNRAIAIAEKAHNHFNIGAVLNGLAMSYDEQERYADAIPLSERALAEMSQAEKSDSVHIAIQLHRLGLLYHAVGRDAEAEQLLNRALVVAQKVQRRQDSNIYTDESVAAELAPLALLDRDKGRFDEAEKLYKQVLDLRQKWVGPDHGSLVPDLRDLATVYHKAGRLSEAEAVYNRALAICEKTFVPGEINTVRILNELTSVYAEQGRFADAMPLVRKSAASGVAAPSAALPALYGARAGGLLTEAQALDDSLNVVQAAKESATGTAVKALNARLAAGSGRLAELVRNDQDLGAESKTLDQQLLAAVGGKGNHDLSAEDALRGHLAAIAQQRQQLAKVFMTEFPDYVALSRPTPLTVHDLQGLLADDEAVVITSLGAKSYVWVVTREKADWKELAVTADDVSKEATTLRAGLNPDDPKPFDTGASFTLYRQVLGPVADTIAGKKRISFVLDGALTSLPPQLLVVSDPAGKELRQVDWLVRHHAATVLPSVGSLKTLRGRIRLASAQKPMVAFADPLFNPDAQRTAPGVAASVAASRGIQGTVADLAKIKTALPPLPDTADEVKRVAGGMPAGQADLFLQRDATETRLKQMALDQYRIVYFATHGLLAGDVAKYTRLDAEPALVLSLPREPTSLDDGLLTASEVSQLRLNAEWVVLSACNTASGEKPGAEALSGLARAFFYAGGRSLLVSNWEVATDSTVALMTGIFAAAADTKLSHAEALQKSMLAMIDDSQHADWVDPKYWAPFIIVGEPAKAN
jgi:CHAT domain-containing protein